MSKLLWKEIQTKLRRHYLLYIEDARQERELLNRLEELDKLYQIAIKEARCLNGWLLFLRNEDISAIERNEWDDRSNINNNLPITNNLHRFENFIRLLRDNPKYVALCVKMLTCGVSMKAQAMLGWESVEEERGALLDTLTFSLYGNIFQSHEFETFRESFRLMIIDELKSHSWNNAYDYLLSNGIVPSSRTNRFGSSQTIEKTNSNYPYHHRTNTSITLSTHSFVLCLYSRMVNRFRGSFLDRILGPSIQDVLSKEGLTFDPDPRVALSDQKSQDLSSISNSLSSNNNNNNNNNNINSNNKNGKRISIFAKMRSLSTAISDRIASQLVTNNIESVPTTYERVNTKGTRRLIAQRQQRLEDSVTYFIDNIIEHEESWPHQIRWMINDFLMVFNEYLPKNEDKTLEEENQMNITCYLLFGIILLPSLQEPNLTGAYTEMPVDGLIRKNLQLVKQILVVILLNDYHNAPNCVKNMNEFIQQQRERIKQYVKSFLKDESKSAQIESNFRMGKISMTLRELDTIHKILFINTSKWSSNNDYQELLIYKDLSSRVQLDKEMLNKHYYINAFNADTTLPLIKDIGRVIEKLFTNPNATSIELGTRRGTTSIRHRSRSNAVINDDELNSNTQIQNEKQAARILRLLTKLFLFMDETYLMHVDRSANLQSLLLSMQSSLKSRLSTDWESASTLLTLLNQIQLYLKKKLSNEYEENDYKLLAEQLNEILQHLQDHHIKVWNERRCTLQLSLETCRQHLASLKNEIRFMDEVLFNRKVLAFVRSVEIPCRLQLPSTIAPREPSLLGIINENTIQPIKSPKHNANNTSTSNAKGPLFYCGSVNTFISEFLEYSKSLQKYPEIAARVLHCFLSITSEKCAEDATFSSDEVDRAMEVIENYITSRIFLFLAKSSGANIEISVSRTLSNVSNYSNISEDDSNSTTKNSNTNVYIDSISSEDQIFTNKVLSLDWIEPRHLDIDFAPADIEFWEPAVNCLLKMEDHIRCRSPRDKLKCMTECVKWLVKVLEAERGGVGTDADTSLSGLIYVILRAKPQSLPSTLQYVITYRPEAKLIGEDGYCLTQFSLAMRFISETLHSSSPKLVGNQSSTTSALAAVASISKDQITTVLRIKRVSHNIFEFLGPNDLHNCILVSQLFNTMTRLYIQSDPLKMSNDGRLDVVDNYAFIRPSLSVANQRATAESVSIIGNKYNKNKLQEDSKTEPGLSRIVSYNKTTNGQSTFDIQMIHKDKEMKEQLLKFVESNHSNDASIRFFLDAEKFKESFNNDDIDLSKQRKLVLELYNTYICTSSQYSLTCLSRSNRMQLEKSMAHILAEAMNYVDISTNNLDNNEDNNNKLENNHKIESSRHLRLGSANDSRSFIISKWIINVRVNLCEQHGGGHITVRCDAGDSIATIKEKTLNSLRKKKLLVDGNKADQYYLHVKNFPIIQNAHEALSVCIHSTVESVVNALMDMSPIELNFVHQSTNIDTSLDIKNILELLKEPNNTSLRDMFDEALTRVLSIIRVSIQPAFVEYMENDDLDDDNDDDDDEENNQK